MNTRDIILARRESAEKFEPTRRISQARMVAINGSVEAGRSGYVWVQGRYQRAGAFQAFSPRIAPVHNLPVLLESSPRPPYQYTVIDVDFSHIIHHPDYDSDVHIYMRRHASTHEWPDGAPGPDPVTVYPRALSVLRTYPGSAGLTVSVAPYIYDRNGAIVTFTGHADYDISGSQPAVGLARYVLIYLDADVNTVGVVNGDTVLDAPPVVPLFPAPPQATFPSAWVRLDGAATVIAEIDIVDARMILGKMTSSSMSLVLLWIGW